MNDLQIKILAMVVTVIALPLVITLLGNNRRLILLILLFVALCGGVLILSFDSGWGYLSQERLCEMIADIEKVHRACGDGSQISGDKINELQGYWDELRDRFPNNIAYDLVKDKYVAELLSFHQDTEGFFSALSALTNDTRSIKFFRSGKFQEQVENWILSTWEDCARPGLGVVVSEAEAQQEQPDYQRLNNSELSGKIRKKIDQWLACPSTEDIQVLFIGANEMPLITNVIMTLRNCTSRNVHIEVQKTRSSELKAIKSFVDTCVQTPDRKFDVVVSRGGRKYDIIFHTHWYQHHKKYRFDDQFKVSPLRKGGLLIWLSAVARTSEGVQSAEYVGEEFVCEGWGPRKAIVWNEESTGARDRRDYKHNRDFYIKFSDFGRSGKTSYIRYFDSWSSRVPDRIRKMNFPRSFVSTNEIVRDETQVGEIMRHCLELAEVQSRDLGFVSDSSAKDFDDIRILRVFRPAGQTRVYSLLGASSHRGARADVFFIAIQDELPVQWGSALREELDSSLRSQITIHTAQCITDGDNGADNECDSILCDTHDAGYKSVTIGPDIEYKCTSLDVVTRHDHIVFRHAGRIYYSCLPKKQYLRGREFDERLKMMSDFMRWTEEFRKRHVEGGASVYPAVSWTVTRLTPFAELRRALSQYGIEIKNANENVYFHKSYGFLKSKKGYAEILYNGRVEKKVRGPDSCHSYRMSDYYRLSIEKDRVFNDLPLCERERLLGELMVHDVLFFAESESDEASMDVHL